MDCNWIELAGAAMIGGFVGTLIGLFVWEKAKKK